MPRRLGSGTKPKYVSFRTSEGRYQSMIKIGKAKGLETKSRVYREAERHYIALNSNLLKYEKKEDDGIKAESSKKRRPKLKRS